MISKRKNDEAVSPVIGVILMVAVTVILAAIVASFVFGTASDMPKGKVVAFSAVKDSSNVIKISNLGGSDVGTISTVTATYDGVAAAIAGNVTTIGGIGTITGTVTAKQLILIGTFNDGTTQVLLNTMI